MSEFVDKSVVLMKVTFEIIDLFRYAREKGITEEEFEGWFKNVRLADWYRFVVEKMEGERE
jgi:hypothetical protein